MGTSAKDLLEDAGANPETWARAVVEDRSSSATKLVTSVEHHDRVDFARAVASHVVSSYWKRRQTASGRGWSLQEPPPDIGLSPVPKEAIELAESIGTVAAGLDVLEAGYRIGVLYLNSGVVDQVFRCINGSVAVSAYELEALPLPPPEDVKELGRPTKSRSSQFNSPEVPNVPTGRNHQAGLGPNRFKRIRAAGDPTGVRMEPGTDLHAV